MGFLEEDKADPLHGPNVYTKQEIRKIEELRIKLNTLYDKWALEEAEKDLMTIPFGHFLRKIHNGMADSWYMEKKFLPKVQDPEYEPDELESLIIEYVFACLNGD